jgi:hypothetical protein
MEIESTIFAVRVYVTLFTVVMGTPGGVIVPSERMWIVPSAFACGTRKASSVVANIKSASRMKPVCRLVSVLPY